MGQHAAAAIVDTITNIGKGVASFFGFDVSDSTDGGAGQQAANDSAMNGGTESQMVSPQDRVARSIEEQRTTSSAEVTIRDETRRAEVTGGELGNGIKLQASGAF